MEVKLGCDLSSSSSISPSIFQSRASHPSARHPKVDRGVQTLSLALLIKQEIYVVCLMNPQLPNSISSEPIALPQSIRFTSAPTKTNRRRRGGGPSRVRSSSRISRVRFPSTLCTGCSLRVRRCSKNERLTKASCEPLLLSAVICRHLRGSRHTPKKHIGLTKNPAVVADCIPLARRRRKTAREARDFSIERGKALAHSASRSRSLFLRLLFKSYLKSREQQAGWGQIHALRVASYSFTFPTEQRRMCLPRHLRALESARSSIFDLGSRKPSDEVEACR